MKKSLLNLALKIAREKLSNHTQQNFLHYTFVVQDNKILDWATNQSVDVPIHYGYNILNPDVFYRPKRHSEIAAYKKTKGLLDRKGGFEVINIRLNRQGQLRSSKPCLCCFEIMRELGCKKIYYSLDSGFLRC